MQKICEQFGWTPQQFLDIDIFYINAFSNILLGRTEGMQAKNPKK